MTIYAVRRKACGCLVSTNPDGPERQSLMQYGWARGERKNHPNGDTTEYMPLEQSARVPQFCRAHRPQEQKQEVLFDGQVP